MMGATKLDKKKNTLHMSCINKKDIEGYNLKIENSEKGIEPKIEHEI
jgi:hypothetical protein